LGDLGAIGAGLRALSNSGIGVRNLNARSIRQRSRASSARPLNNTTG
jgi:hypothetical protein